MPLIHVTKILDSVTGTKKDGSAYVLPEDLDANAFIHVGQEALQVTRMARIEISAELVTIFTHKGERFFFSPDQLVGLKFGPTTARAARSSAGFST